MMTRHACLLQQAVLQARCRKRATRRVICFGIAVPQARRVGDVAEELLAALLAYTSCSASASAEERANLMLREAEEEADAERRDDNDGPVSLTIINYHRSRPPTRAYRSSFARAKPPQVRTHHRSPSPHPSISYKSAFAREKNRRRSSTRSSGGPA